ncbi:transcription antitermination protein [Halobellus ruber]|uniref:Transcription antitermination protein n=1 Tax=Halobellus ruber TaxID=2761102 RepID=A0A7J9SPI2_9EURY|nr:transcription antitermination protein [Halobellus ruber]MBB6647371.1 transcription antitermination protein [Halobellus ruber]
MNGEDLASELRDDHETEFSRLGSSKAMYALTGGEMDGDRVRAAAATDALAFAAALEAWDPDDPTGELYPDLAAAAREHAAAVADDPSLDEEPPLYDALAGFDATPARLGGLLGRYLVVSEYASQMVGFFVGDADPMAANDFRDLRSEVDAERDRVVDALNAACGADEEWAVARDAAETVIEAAYDDYVETLESMGIKPKNVC